jgi:diguanylate cyclase (GGDEF)-like protein/PAS domain S-box-containing protein
LLSCRDKRQSCILPATVQLIFEVRVRHQAHDGKHIDMPAEPDQSELARLRALLDYHILDTLPERTYDDIAKLAQLICRMPICAVTFVDRERQWFKAKVGLDVTETSRNMSFCSQAIAQDEEIFEIPDTLADARFRENPLVTGDPKIRFYAGASITDGNGNKVGAVCAIDRVPRRLSEAQRKGLAALARQVAVLLHGRAALAELLEKERFKYFLDNSPVVAFLKEAEGPLLYVNKTFFRLFEKTPADIFERPYVDIWPPEFARRMALQDRDVIRTNRPIVCEYVADKDRQSQRFWQVYKFPIADGDKRLVGGIAIDITDDKRRQQHLENEVDRLGVLSNTDALTGIGNRRILDDRLAAEIDFSKRHKEPLSFLMVDVDRFKAFNDRFGHIAGDRLLASIAKTLVENSRMHDVVGRFGGEEFGVILRCTTLESAAGQAERLRMAVEKMQPKDVTISIGVAQFDLADEDASRMVIAADAALYAAKDAGRNRVSVAPAGTVVKTMARKRRGRAGIAPER